MSQERSASTIPEGDWEALHDYLRRENEFLHKLLRAVVSLEKKVYWCVPTGPVMKTKCTLEWDPDACACHDPAGSDDEGDKGGSGDIPVFQ